MFSFNEIYNISGIHEAFDKICFNKMLADGYFDMSLYVDGRINKVELRTELKKENSKYLVLYDNPFPYKVEIEKKWNEFFETKKYSFFDASVSLTETEAKAIVNWVYKSYKNFDERKTFTQSLLSDIKEFHEIENNVKYLGGVVYNQDKVELHFIKNVNDFNQLLLTLEKEDDKKMFYRGHSDCNYILLPSVFREEQWKTNENQMYNEVMINCPDNFENCKSHLEKLVEMQHYGLPTRLLDITRNPLVALYFACESKDDCYGEVILISTEASKIKYPQSDTVSILSSISTFNNEDQRKFLDYAMDFLCDEKEFNEKISRLVHEVRVEKPAFQAEICREDLMDNFLVYALKNNNRIVKQDGAFILCGLVNNKNSLNKFRYKRKDKNVIVLIENKKEILKILDKFSINYASLFPEIECVAEHIKKVYS